MPTTLFAKYHIEAVRKNATDETLNDSVVENADSLSEWQHDFQNGFEPLK